MALYENEWKSLRKNEILMPDEQFIDIIVDPIHEIWPERHLNLELNSLRLLIWSIFREFYPLEQYENFITCSHSAGMCDCNDCAMGQPLRTKS